MPQNSSARQNIHTDPVTSKRQPKENVSLHCIPGTDGNLLTFAYFFQRTAPAFKLGITIKGFCFSFLSPIPPSRRIFSTNLLRQRRSRQLFSATQKGVSVDNYFWICFKLFCEETECVVLPIFNKDRVQQTKGGLFVVSHLAFETRGEGRTPGKNEFAPMW